MCEQLAVEFGETVNLAVLRSHYAVNVDQVARPGRRRRAQLGRRTDAAARDVERQGAARAPARPGAQGRCSTPPAWSGSPNARSPGAVSSPRCCRPSSRDGFATTVEEYEDGLNAIAAPVRDHTGAGRRRGQRVGTGLPARRTPAGEDRLERHRGRRADQRADRPLRGQVATSSCGGRVNRPGGPAPTRGTDDVVFARHQHAALAVHPGTHRRLGALAGAEVLLVHPVEQLTDRSTSRPESTTSGR